MSDKALPHNIEAEKSVLGGILIDNDSYYDVAPFLSPAAFYHGTHRDIYTAMVALMARQTPVDPVTMRDELSGKNLRELDTMLIDLALVVPTSSRTRHYGQIVEKLHRRRQLIRAGGAIATAAWDETQTVDEVTGAASKALFDAVTANETRGVRSAREVASALLDRLGAGPRRGMPTGFVDLDKLLKGLHRTDLVVLAGRPGMGKSSIEGAIARNVALNGGGVVVRFNLEMSAEQLMYRDISDVSGVPFDRLRDNELTEAEQIKAADALGKLSECGMFYDDTPGITPLQLESRCRQIAMGRDIDLITVDYIQLMRPDGKYANRTQEVGAVSRALKGLAKSLDVPVLANAQLSRAVEQRADKRPQLSDLRDSGEIEQDADVVMFVYRDEYYYQMESERPNQVDVIVAKHRNGKTGDVSLFWKDGKVRNLRAQPINL